jgi:hypothetical protein
MSLSVISDADYECTLTENSVKKAKEELNEDPNNRLGAVKTFREWILQQPHIKCPTDTRFLLPFLRVRYFSQLEARKLLENYLSSRTKLAHWYKNLDPADPKIQAYFDSGCVLILPERDDEGRQVYFFRPGFLDTTDKASYSKVDVMRALACLCDYFYLIDENTTVCGTVTIADFSNYTMKHGTYWTLEETKDIMQSWQGAYPARVKQFHLYNTGAMMEFLTTVIKFCMPEKLQQRLKFHGQVLESLYKYIPMRLLPVEYLPDDYTGPNAGIEKQLIERLKQQILQPEVRSRIMYLSSDQFGIDEKKRPSDAPVGSFRKLNLD